MAFYTSILSLIFDLEKTICTSQAVSIQSIERETFFAWSGLTQTERTIQTVFGTTVLRNCYICDVELLSWDLDSWGQLDVECSICKNTVCCIEVIIGFHAVNSERDDIKLCLSIIHIRKGSLIKIKTLSLIRSIIDFESEIKILIVTYREQNVKFHEIALVVSELQTQIKRFVLTAIHIFERCRICLQRTSGISLYEWIIVINFVGRRIVTTSSTRV